MDERQKPFACTIDGCDMTFTNEDHLNWHHKKHDMVLNLGLANKNAEVADQTPTPTRFIRNCEEVGLFQDLQNVNPFDETFKKAIECAKTGTLHVPESASNDDTLHTPRILLNVESTNTRAQSHAFSETDEEPNDLIIITDESDKGKDKAINLKDKLKETLKNKGKSPAVITPVPIEKLIPNTDEGHKRGSTTEETIDKKRKTTKSISSDKAKIREMNRAAQLRCRQRKQVQWQQMEVEIKHLKSENAKLSQENQHFKHKFYALKELLLKHKDGLGTSFVTSIEEILNSPAPVLRLEQKIKNKVPITPPILPLALVHCPKQKEQVPKPVLIKVMGSVQQLAVSILPK